MPNHSRTQDDATWVDGYDLTRDDLEDLDRKVFGSWNGDRGGAYCAPKTGGAVYDFGGSGLHVTGPTRLTMGGALMGGANVFKIRDGTWPELGVTHAGRARSIGQALDQFFSPRPYLWSLEHAYGGIGSVALACRSTFGRTVEVPEFYAPLRVIDGSTLSSVKLHFRVASRRIYAPLAMPKMRVLRVPRDSRTTTPQPLKLTSDGLGFDSPALVTSPSAWFLDGAPQAFTYVCDQNHVIDVENYTYVVHVVEELGADSPEQPFDGIRFVERKTDVERVVLNTNALTGQVGTEGNLTQNNQRILVVDPQADIDASVSTQNSVRNGIWVASNAGAWTRATDLGAQSDFTPNWIVRVRFGSINAGALWQCEHPSSNSPTNLGSVPDATSTRPLLVPAKPRGNIYHSVVPTFEVSDLRFQ